MAGGTCRGTGSFTSPPGHLDCHRELLKSDDSTASPTRLQGRPEEGSRVVSGRPKNRVEMKELSQRDFLRGNYLMCLFIWLVLYLYFA